tara:strand:+ start:668 stop:799 length:132 start_codon:yes stop_codon:yes gene_type:complete
VAAVVVFGALFFAGLVLDVLLIAAFLLEELLLSDVLRVLGVAG